MARSGRRIKGQREKRNGRKERERERERQREREKKEGIHRVGGVGGP